MMYVDDDACDDGGDDSVGSCHVVYSCCNSLFSAAARGYVDIVKVLMDHGIDVNLVCTCRYPCPYNDCNMHDVVMIALFVCISSCL